ncbi:MAG: hypothetical protein ABIR62_09405 [Dokdonella sp.]|uniref:hypothetical protein n=1 Tax=Dokdonella sp. TaxID=2291710 RepID=UPI0032661085
MDHFRSFEIEALMLLGAEILGEALVNAVVRDAEFVSYDYSGVGYCLTVRHHHLPSTRIVLHEPMVLGRVGEMLGSYLAFVEHHELMLEYAGFADVPDNIRDLDVQVEVQANAT